MTRRRIAVVVGDNINIAHSTSTMKQISLALFLCFCFHTHGFTLTSELFSSCVQANSYCRTHRSDAPPPHRQYLAAAADDDEDTDASASDDVAISVIIDTNLSESNTQKLFAWIKCAFDYDESDKNDVYAYYYTNIELAIAAAFGSNLPENSLPSKLMQMAMKKEGLLDDNKSGSSVNIEWAETLIGEPIGRRDRESASLGAMGAAQWTGQWLTRPHCECATISLGCIECFY